MKTIKSFTIDHLTLLPGVYESRLDSISKNDAFDSLYTPPVPHEKFSDGDLLPVTTYDIRITRPNFEPVMETGEIHTIEHLGATYLRNRKDLENKIIYWGPMGCRTGFYLIVADNHKIPEIVKLMQDTFGFIKDFKGEIPGATPKECGNYSDMDLPAAKARAEKYLKVLNK